MNAFTKLKEEALLALKKAPELAGVAITDEYPCTGKPLILSEPLLAVGFSKLSVEPGGFDSCLGVGDKGEELRGGKCRAVFLFTLCAPRTDTAPHIVGLFDRLGAVLFDRAAFPVPVFSLSGDSIVFDKTLGCPVLKAYAETEFWFAGTEETAGDITDYTVRSVAI